MLGGNVEGSVALLVLHIHTGTWGGGREGGERGMKLLLQYTYSTSLLRHVSTVQSYMPSLDQFALTSL